MNILYIYRSKELGPSIRRVFNPVEQTLQHQHNVDSIYLPIATASPLDIIKNAFFVKKQVKKKKYDIVHITGHVTYLAWILKKYNTIATIHDLGFFVNHRDRKLRSIYLYWLCIKPLTMCKAVTFISKKSMDEANAIISFGNVNLSVIPNPYSSDFVYMEKKKCHIKAHILHIGTKPNKNLLRVIDALEDIPCHLRIIGQIDDVTISRLKDKKIDYSNECNVSDVQIVSEYYKCDIVSFPSLYEGFGMSIIEGQAIGRVVVTSNLSPMKEIAGKGAVLIDPFSVDSINDGFKRAIRDSSKYIEEGRKNVKQYSVSNIAKQYNQLYYKILIDK